jgi:hypothetical protein
VPTVHIGFVEVEMWEEVRAGSAQWDEEARRDGARVVGGERLSLNGRLRTEGKN